MRIFKIQFNNLVICINDDLEVVNDYDLNDKVSIWSKKDSKNWVCEKRSIPSYVSQLHLKGFEYFPTKIIFFLTSSCNLDCKYCYSKLSSINYSLHFDSCKAVIDKMIENLIKIQRKTLKIKFHGGGEPFVAFDLMRRVVDYAKFKSEEEALKLKVDVSTNGMLTDEHRYWIFQNVNRLSISFDGTEDLQRNNRPAKNKEIDSYLELKKTIQFFDSISFPFTLRITITNTNNENVHNIILESRRLSKKAIKKLELVCENKSETTSQLKLGKSINYVKFLSEYFQEKIRNEEDLISFDACDGGYGQCGAWGDNLILDGLNNISTCFKYSAFGVNSPFFICCLNDFLNKQIFLDRTNKIVKITKKAENECAYCFLWKKCGGGCLALRDENNFNLNCDILRTFFMTKIINENKD